MGNKLFRKKLSKNNNTPNETTSKTSTINKSSTQVKVPRRLSTCPIQKKKVDINDFLILKVLGRGSFGKVCLVRKTDSDQLFALKALNKEALLRRNQIAHTQTERMILADISHPFLVSLEFAFQSETRLYLVLEFMQGGELFYWLRKATKFTTQRAKLYAAEVLLALEFLHTNDIVYRDLKPENILLDKSGHCKLTDFGLSKEGIVGHCGDTGATTFCGTPEYLAPEILDATGHGKAVDWWSLGVLVCEMLTGDPPFYSKNVQRMYKKILHHPPHYTNELDEDAKLLIDLLLQKDPTLRIGSDPKRDSLDIRKSLFFKNYSSEPLVWEHVLKKKYTPVFIPPISDITSDTLNIDNYYMKQSIKNSVVITLSTEQIQSTKFDGFSYQGNKEDSNALSKLRRNSNNPEAWASLMRRSSGLPRTSRVGTHTRDLSDIQGDEEEEEEEEDISRPSQISKPPSNEDGTWISHYDDETQRTYYENQITGRTTWTEA